MEETEELVIVATQEEIDEVLIESLKNEISSHEETIRLLKETNNKFVERLEEDESSDSREFIQSMISYNEKFISWGEQRIKEIGELLSESTN